MRQLREIIRLSLEAGLSTRKVGEQVGVGATTVRDTLKRFAREKLTWPIPASMSDADLEQCLYKMATGEKPVRRKPEEPDWSAVARELKRKQRDAAGSLGGIPRQTSDRIPVLAILPSLPGMGGPAAAGDAAELCRRREAVCRLCW